MLKGKFSLHKRALRGFVRRILLVLLFLSVGVVALGVGLGVGAP